MKELFLDKSFEQNTNKSVLQIEIQTITVLRHLDTARKKDVIDFLYQNGLIRHDRPFNIKLHEADLSGIQFRKSSRGFCSFQNISLKGIYAENMVFEDCVLFGAVFDSAHIYGATFKSCSLAYSQFSGTNLTQVNFHNNHLYKVNFKGAHLLKSSVTNGVFQDVDLTNADLFQSDIGEELLDSMNHGGLKPNIFLNTRYPNGSFSVVNTQNLVSNGQAQTEVCLMKSFLLNIIMLLFCFVVSRPVVKVPSDLGCAWLFAVLHCAFDLHYVPA